MAEGPAGARPLAATTVVLPALLAVLAAGEAAADCPTPVAHLVSVVGEVRLNGELPTGTLPAIPVCPGDTVEVGPDSRAGAYLLDADTPLQLEEDTLGRFQPPPEPGSGLVELVRGAVYFLSEVRRTLTIRTPYVTAGVEGTEVYLRAGRPGSTEGAELLVLEGRVAVTPGDRTPALGAQAATTGERLAVAADGGVRRTALPGGDGAYAALRRVAVGELSWTLFYPDVLVAAEARPFPRITDAARLLAAGQVAEAEAVLADVPGDSGREVGLRDALRSTVAFARKGAADAARLAEAGRTAAPDAATPLVALSYARQLALDLDGAVAAAGAAAEAAPRSPLPRARLAELRLMRGETRAARREARAATDLGGGPLADIAFGYADLAALRGGAAEAAFRSALATESANPLALLGLGLARIKQGHLEEGRRLIENAVAHDPSSSLLRSYLGKGYFEERRDEPAGKQLAIAKDLDPSDPTPWFYDAIRKQLDNRPVEALRDLERSIELNDNRAPFRSRLLLDQDRAARGVGLARIYTDLGFERLGVLAATKALAQDPAGAAGHRYLSDLYSEDPDLDVARVSELLQAQLLQPVGLNSVQPSFPFTDLNIVASAAPRTLGFNEYGQLFNRDGWQLQTTGFVGSDDLHGDEITAATLLGRTNISLGQFYYDTDGFRPNNQLQHKIYNIFAQTALNEAVDAQFEVRRRGTNRGDRRFNYFLDQPNEGLDESVDETIYRVGGKARFGARHTLLLSGVARDRDERGRDATANAFGEVVEKDHGSRDATQLETQLLSVGNELSSRFGAGGYWVDIDQSFRDQAVTDGLTETADGKRAQENEGRNIYGYLDWAPFQATQFVLGLALEQTNLPSSMRTALQPKIGLVHQLTSYITLRAAYFESTKRDLSSDQTLEPTTLAGFHQFTDDINGSHGTTLAGALDLRLGQRLYVGVEGKQREISLVRTATDPSGLFQRIDRDVLDGEENSLEGYVYWLPSDRLSARTGIIRKRFSLTKSGATGLPAKVDNLRVPVELRYFGPSGLFLMGSLSYNEQDIGVRQPDLDQDDSGAFLVDAAAGFRFPNRRGSFVIEVDNLFDKDFRYLDNSFRTSEQPDPLFLPSRTVFARLSLNF